MQFYDIDKAFLPKGKNLLPALFDKENFCFFVLSVFYLLCYTDALSPEPM
jgi:hypothetical protein